MRKPKKKNFTIFPLGIVSPHPLMRSTLRMPRRMCGGRSSLSAARRHFSFGPFSSPSLPPQSIQQASNSTMETTSAGPHSASSSSASSSSSSPFPSLPIEMMVPGRASVTQRVASAPADVRKPFGGPHGPVNGTMSVTGGRVAGPSAMRPFPTERTSVTGLDSRSHPSPIQSVAKKLTPSSIAERVGLATATASSSTGASAADAQIASASPSSSAAHEVVHSAKMSAAAGASAFAGALHRATGHTILPNDDVQSHAEHCVMGYAGQQIYNVVADVERYHEFLPWCTKSIVLHEDLVAPLTTKKVATLHVGFAFLKEQYTSDVTLVPGKSIVATIKGSSTLLKELTCYWAFRSLDGTSSEEDAQLLAYYFSSDRKHQHRESPSSKLLHRLVSAGGSKHHDADGHHHQPPPVVGRKQFPPASVIDFRVTFAFRNPLHNSLSSLVMSNVVSVMTSSFETRCQNLYGKPTTGRMALSAAQLRIHEKTQAAPESVVRDSTSAEEKKKTV